MATSQTTTANRPRTLIRPNRSRNRLATVPDIRYADEYIRRSFGPGLSDYIVYDFARNNQINVLIEGPTGAGKTSSILAWAAKREYRFYSISSSIGIEPSQLFGKYIPAEEEDKDIVWQDGPVTDLVRNGGVLLLNEVNFIPDRIGTVLFSLLDKRREIQLVDHKAEVVRAHLGGEDCWCNERNDDGEKECNRELSIFADMNPDYSGTHPLNAAFRNRFSIQLQWDYDERVEKRLVDSPTLLKMAKQLRERLTTGDFETPTSTNMLQAFLRDYEFMGWEFAVMNFCNHFNAEERQSLGQVINTHKDELQRDLAKIERMTPYGDPANHPKDGEYGKKWVYDDEDLDGEGTDIDGETGVADDDPRFDMADELEG